MAVIVSTTEVIVPVVKSRLFDYIRFQTKMTNPDLLGDTDLCQIASIAEQNEARVRKFITKTVEIQWEAGDSDAELPSDYFEIQSYVRGSNRNPVKAVTMADFNGYTSTFTDADVSIRFNGTNWKVYLPSAATESFSDYLLYTAVPVYPDPSAWNPSFSLNYYGMMAAAIILEVLGWIATNPDQRISDIQRKLAMEAGPFWQLRYREAARNLSVKTTLNNNFKGSY